MESILSTYLLIYVHLFNRVEEKGVNRVVIVMPAEAVDDPDCQHIVEQWLVPVLELYEAEPEEEETLVAPST